MLSCITKVSNKALSNIDFIIGRKGPMIVSRSGDLNVIAPTGVKVFRFCRNVFFIRRLFRRTFSAVSFYAMDGEKSVTEKQSRGFDAGIIARERNNRDDDPAVIFERRVLLRDPTHKRAVNCAARVIS